MGNVFKPLNNRNTVNGIDSLSPLPASAFSCRSTTTTSTLPAVTPPRRAKRSSADFCSSPSFTEPRAIFPMRTYAPRPSTSSEATFEPPPPPAKRGRKPGPLSRTAREAQRRLNHSIIEKARRTKINDALATLKELVPMGYGQVKPPPAESAAPDDEDDDDDYTEGIKKAKPKSKGTGKKEEKEKEFKLEILVRTVSFLQDLLKRVADLEATVSTPSMCQDCSGAGHSDEKQAKRKRIHLEEDDREDDRVQETARFPTSRGAKALRLSESAPTSTANAKIPQEVPISPGSLLMPSTPVSPPPTADGARLPSISSWLPNSVIDPQLLPPSNRPSSSPHIGSYLPSPPSSAHVDPVRTSHMPPVLSLGPVATAAMVNAPRSATSTTSSGSRTAEDESAASLLLQIRAGSSPNFRPVPSSPSSSAYGLPDPSNFLLHSDVRSQREGNHVRQAQTPGSMLGMNAGSRTF